MKVALIRNDVVEWRSLADDIPWSVPVESRRSETLISHLHENPVEAVLGTNTTEGLERACAIRKDESFVDLPIVVLAPDQFPALLSRKVQEDLRQQWTSLWTNSQDSVYPPRRLHVDQRAREIWMEGTYQCCSPMEFRLFLFLLQYPRIVFCREELVKRARLAEGPVDARIIDVLIRRLRRKIEVIAQAPRNLRTVQRLGYLFDYEGDTFIDVETNTPIQPWAYPPVVTFCSSHVY
jgi:DNA-binding winged helix-turn-helix (wHTH) protein